MKSGVVVIITGTIMIMFGGILFYTIQNSLRIEPALRIIKHAGTFIGLLGIGVTVAGILLFLINRPQAQIEDHGV